MSKMGGKDSKLKRTGEKILVELSLCERRVPRDGDPKVVLTGKNQKVEPLEVEPRCRIGSHFQHTCSREKGGG